MTSSTITETGNILDGKLVAGLLHKQLAERVGNLALKETGRQPKLVVVLVGDDPASQVYVNKKAKTAIKIGMASEVLVYPATMTQSELMDVIQRLNADGSVHGILVQLPLPAHLCTEDVVSAISPQKDVDGLHPVNMGQLLSGSRLGARPCTPSGIITLLKHYQLTLVGKNAVVLGRSNIVGKPMGLLLLEENATVTYCHSKTRNLSALAREADILISAIGIPEMVTVEYVKPGAVVVDVGINRVNNKLVGDVAFAEVSKVARWLTPVPGGVGPMTIATLMANTLAAFEQQMP